MSVQRHCSPFPDEAPLGRVDAGVDYAHAYHGPIFAIGDGIVTQFDPPGGHAWGGLGAVYYRLSHPVWINDREYEVGYSAEAGHYSLLHVGMRVRMNERIAYTSSGWQESGFYEHQDMNSQVPTLQGQDYLAFVKLMRKRHPRHV